MHTLRDYFRTIFPVRPEERARVLLMFLYSLCAIGGVLIAGRAISRTLFLSMLPQSMTPFKYILPPLFIMGAAAVYTRMTPRYPQYRLIIGTSLLMTSGVLVFRFLMETPYGSEFWVLAGFFIFIEVASMLIGVQFWTFAAEMFTTREARRLLGTIALGGILANSVSGAALSLASQYVVPQDLLFVVALGLLGSVLCVRALESRRRQGEETSHAAEEFPPLRKVFGEIRASSLILAIGGIMVVMAVVATIVEYQLDLSLQRFFSADGQAMLSFLGGFQFWVGIAGLLVQLFLTNHILARFGLVVALLIMPIGIGAGSAFILITSGLLWSVALTRGATLSLRYSLNDVALNVLFLPVPGRLRRQAKTVLEGIVKPPILGLLGVIFLLVMNDDIDLVGVQASDITPWSYVVLALLAVWAALIFVVRREYTEALASTLRRRRLNSATDELDLTDETTARVLEDSLRSEDPSRVVYALNLISAAPAPRWDAQVSSLMQHPSPEVRTAALQYAATSGRETMVSEVEDLLDAPETDVRAAAISAYCALHATDAVSRVLPYLNDDSPSVQAAVVCGIVLHGGFEGILQGATKLKEMVDSPDPEIRHEAAELLGELGIANFYQPLLLLMQDDDARVVRSAIRSAGMVRHNALVPMIVSKLDERGMAPAAQSALVNFGPGIEQTLAPNLTGVAEGCTPGIRRQLPAVLGQIPTEQSAAILLKHIGDPDPTMRGRSLSALQRLAERGVDFSRDGETLLPLMLDEIRTYYGEVAVWEDLGPSGRGELLADILTAEQSRTHDRIFTLLHLLYPDQDIDLIRHALTETDRRLRANAIELLDVVTDQEVSHLLIPILEADNTRLLEIGENLFGIARRSREDRLAELASGPASWLRSCALYQIGVLGIQALEPEVQEATDCEDALVRETALLAGRSLMNPERLRETATRHAENDPDPVVRRYASALAASPDLNQ